MKRVVVTPAGRKRYLEILFEYMYREKNNGGFDIWHLWVNTNNQEDIEFCKMLSHRNLWIKTIEFPDTNCVSRYNIHKFYKYACEEDCMYLKLDDDIVYIEEGFFDKIFRFREENPDYFLVYPNILNNPITSFIHYRNGLIKSDKIPTYNPICEIGWKNGIFAENLHNDILTSLEVGDKNLDKWRSSFKIWKLCQLEKMPINSICWFGKVFKEFEGKVGVDDNQFLAFDKPNKLQMKNIVFGDAIIVHFGFYTQKDHIESTELLNRYRKISMTLNNYKFE